MNLGLAPRNALLDYVEMVCKQISKRFVKPPDWWTPPTGAVPPPSLRKPDQLCFEDNKTKNSRLCVRCQEGADEEERKKEEQREKEKNEKKDKGDAAQRLRDRKRRRAAEANKKKQAKRLKAKK